MTRGKFIELSLRAVAFSALCAIIAYILFTMILFAVIIVQVASTIFFIMSMGWTGG